jgi:hypothetical protein
VKLIRTDACSAHRAALLDFVDSREREGVPRAALAHLEHCGVCEAEITDLALAVAALRRLAADVATAEPPTNAWTALHARIDSRDRVAGRGPSVFGNLFIRAALPGALAMAIVAASVATHVGGPSSSPLAAGRQTAFDPSTAIELTVDRGRAPIRASAAELASIILTPTAWSGPDGLGINRATKTVPHRPNPTGGAI